MPKSPQRPQPKDPKAQSPEPKAPKAQSLLCSPEPVRIKSSLFLSDRYLAMIAVQGVSMRYGSKVLFDDVTTTFSAGRRYGLTGPNGAGKSTFMKLLTGEIPP